MAMITPSDCWWLEVFESFSDAHEPNDVLARVIGFARKLGFTYCSYGIRVPVSMTQPVVAILDNYPGSWMDHYERQDFLAIDPTVRLGANHSEPIVWSNALFARAPALWRDAQDAGLRVGVAQSSWGGTGAYGLLTLARDAEQLSESELQSLRPRLRWLAENAHQRMQPHYADALAREHLRPLSPREHEVLCWTADGKTSWETAQILQISERTVNFHIQNVLTKLNAQNKIQASVKAAALGMLVGGRGDVLPTGKAKETQSGETDAASPAPAALPGVRIWQG